MDKGTVHIYYGTGKGKTTAAIGQAIKTASEGKTAFVIQFLKERKEDEIGFLKRLEPEVKLFRFQKSVLSYGDLSDEEQADENQNLRNGLNFAKKVLVTEECDVLVLDEVLGLLRYGIVTAEELRQVIPDPEGQSEIGGNTYDGDKGVSEISRGGNPYHGICHHRF